MRPEDMRTTGDPDPELNAMLGALDHPTPRVSAASLAARAPTRARRDAWLRRAAVVVLAVGVAGAAWALPGSPLRAWWDARAVESPGEPATAEAPAPAPADSAPTGGVALDPSVPQVVVFATAPRALLDVVVVEGSTLTLESFGGGARFAADPERLRVERIDAGTRFRLTVPRAAESVEVRVGPSVVWRWPDGTGASTHRIPLDR